MQQARILIADDDSVLRFDLHTLLESLGHEVVGEAENGEAACYMARSLKPDLAILDIMMPRMTGLEAAQIINKERLCPVILLTAFSDVPIIEQANKAGVLAYLVKPYREQELQPNIEIALARYREMMALECALGSAQETIDNSRQVGKAKRVLMERNGISEQEAYRRIQAQALATQKSVRDIADAILITQETALFSSKTKRTKS